MKDKKNYCNLKYDKNQLNTFLKEVARNESYNKKGSDSWGFNKGVRATLITLGFDEKWIENTLETFKVK